MNERIDGLRDAVNRAMVMAGTSKEIKGGQNVRCLFTSPEYSFADPDEWDIDKPAIQTSTTHVQTLIDAACELSGFYNGLLLIPGTVAYREKVTRDYDRAWNAAFAAHGGRILERFEKRGCVGEVTPQETFGTPRLQFMGGVGYGQFTLGTTSFGMEICYDAIYRTLPNDVDVHVVMAGSAGKQALHKGTQFVVIADPGYCDVIKCGPYKVRPRGTDECMHGVTMHYFAITLEGNT